jgi:uncharacterized protein (TIGR02266 family)
MTVDQRKSLRKSLSVRFHAKDGQGFGQLVFESADISAGGAFLRSELLFEPGEALALSFAAKDGRVIEAQAKVAWVRRFPHGQEPAGMGVEFVSVSDDSRRALEAFLGGDG